MRMLREIARVPSRGTPAVMKLVGSRVRHNGKRAVPSGRTRNVRGCRSSSTSRRQAISLLRLARGARAPRRQGTDLLPRKRGCRAGDAEDDRDSSLASISCARRQRQPVPRECDSAAVASPQCSLHAKAIVRLSLGAPPDATRASAATAIMRNGHLYRCPSGCRRIVCQPRGAWITLCCRSLSAYRPADA